ncbi:DUF2069 domain-containing protein [Luteimonas kalidii]|uniref:DUF2069 domain-containing protein n=1 Tax=Luteimonas kalidii TaxID=3042025 RepID=A0ABT6JRS3_9GAMM|nr:DUF2069 domain-containing protein [Luteimonas kalidii]MDH5833172.1 DUF2069 domain-containing protein [Luteimonas kalidii]
MIEGAVRRRRPGLAAVLAALAALYAAWFAGDRHMLAALLVFVLPLLLLLAGVLAGSGRAAFWAGVLGLLLFCHAVMTAWSEPGERGFALAATALSVLLVFASSWPGLRARFGRRRA